VQEVLRLNDFFSARDIHKDGETSHEHTFQLMVGSELVRKAGQIFGYLLTVLIEMLDYQRLMSRRFDSSFLKS
jgi:hypothetical protein